MKTIHIFAVLGIFTLALPCIAEDRHFASPRQLAHCMAARVKENEGESYREAFKTCKQQLAHSASAPEPEAVTAMNGAVSGDPAKQ